MFSYKWVIHNSLAVLFQYFLEVVYVIILEVYIIRNEIAVTYDFHKTQVPLLSNFSVTIYHLVIPDKQIQDSS